MSLEFGFLPFAAWKHLSNPSLIVENVDDGDGDDDGDGNIFCCSSFSPTRPPCNFFRFSSYVVSARLSPPASTSVLCDSDTFVVSIGEFNDVGMEGFTSTNVLYKDSHLMAGVQSRQRHSSMGHVELPKSEPAQWPGEV